MSTVKTQRTQYGISTNPNNNFVVDASQADGTLKISRGNVGATTQDILTVSATGEVNFLSGGVVFWPGWIAPMARMTAPVGWLLVDGKTVGNAASGATSRANADTAALFTELWNFPAASVPIYSSTGAVSTRGVSAAADFAANKRIALFTPDGGAFLRMWAQGQTRDAGRVAGSIQEQQLLQHQHIENSTGNGQGHGGELPVVNTLGSTWTSGAGLLGGPGDAGSENRPYNLSMPHYIKL